MKPWQLFDVCFFKTNNISSLKHLLCGRLIWVVGSFPRKIGWQDKFSQVESKAAGTSVNKRSQKQLWIIQRPSASTQCNFDVYNHRVFNNPLRLLLSFCCCWLTDCSFPLRSISSSSSLLSLPTTVGCPPNNPLLSSSSSYATLVLCLPPSPWSSFISQYTVSAAAATGQCACFSFNPRLLLKSLCCLNTLCGGYCCHPMAFRLINYSNVMCLSSNNKSNRLGLWSIGGRVYMNNQCYYLGLLFTQPADMFRTTRRYQ